LYTAERNFAANGEDWLHRFFWCWLVSVYQLILETKRLLKWSVVIVVACLSSFIKKFAHTAKPLMFARHIYCVTLVRW